MDKRPFSETLEQWLSSKGDKTIYGLSSVFAEKSFAIIFILFMSLPSLPIPTGGITHVFEAIVMLLSLELIIGRRTIWLPKRWRKMKLGGRTQKKALPFIMRRIRWFEKYSRPRLGAMITHRYFVSLLGLIIFAFTLGAFLAPPFSGLDTLPALGVVVTSLSLILEDVVLLIGGLVIGSVGIALELTIGSVVVHFVQGLIF